MDMMVHDAIVVAARLSGVVVEGSDQSRSKLKVYVSGSGADEFRDILIDKFGYSVSRGFIDGNGYVFEIE